MFVYHEMVHSVWKEREAALRRELEFQRQAGLESDNNPSTVLPALAIILVTTLGVVGGSLVL